MHQDFQAININNARYKTERSPSFTQTMKHNNYRVTAT